MNFSLLQKDPFRVFFPLGWLTGILGVGLWLPLAWGTPDLYPMQAHRLTMIGGFLLSFATGFLATAIPRFTSTDFIRPWEFVLLAAGQGTAILTALTPHPPGHYLSVMFTVVLLIVFAGRRFVNRQENPPFTFVFVGAGLVLWGSASTVLALSQWGLSHPNLVVPAQSLYVHGALLCLVIGVGGRLIPGILGWESIVIEQRQRYEKADAYTQAIPKTLILALVVFLVSYGLEGLMSTQGTWTLRTVIMGYVALRYWKLHNLPRERTGFTWGVWIACWSFLAGLFIPVVWPASGVHGIHVMFIGGFSLLTILVATRVTLAHGTGGKELESSSTTLKFLVILFVLAMLTRVVSVTWPRVYRSHLGYAAVLWIAGALAWAALFLPRILTDYETSPEE